MDPSQSTHITLARHDLRVELLEKTVADLRADIRSLDARIAASELKDVAMDAALQSIIESRRLVTGAVVTNIVGLLVALLFLLPVLIDRHNSTTTRPALTISK
jgi:uncharacterized protein YlxW (UPF0749 family)